MGVQKPIRWPIDPNRVAPEWRWFWKAAVSACVCWEQGGVVYDYAARVLLPKNATPDWVATPRGIAIDLNSNGDSFQVVTPTSVRVGYPLTIFTGFTPDLATQPTAHATMYGTHYNTAGTSPFASWYFVVNASRNAVRVSCNTAGTLRTIFASGGPAFVAGARMDMAVTLEDGDQVIYNNGAVVASETQALAAAPNYASDSLLTFGDGVTAARYPDGQFHYGYALKGKVSVDNIEKLARDPNGPFRMGAVPPVFAFTPAVAADAIMNQLQSGNVGADLYNGTIL